MRRLVGMACALVLIVAASGCITEPTDGPYTAEEVLHALQADGLQYFDHGASTECGEHTAQGPTAYEGNGTRFVMWVYETGNEGSTAWGDYTGELRGENGLESWPGCFGGAAWIARRANIVIAFPIPQGDVTGAGTPSQVANVLGRMRAVESGADWREPS